MYTFIESGKDEINNDWRNYPARGAARMLRPMALVILQIRIHVG
jgi:hypothetical protein